MKLVDPDKPLLSAESEARNQLSAGGVPDPIATWLAPFCLRYCRYSGEIIDSTVQHNALVDLSSHQIDSLRKSSIQEVLECFRITGGNHDAALTLRLCHLLSSHEPYMHEVPFKEGRGRFPVDKMPPPPVLYLSAFRECRDRGIDLAKGLQLLASEKWIEQLNQGDLFLFNLWREGFVKPADVIDRCWLITLGRDPEWVGHRTQSNGLSYFYSGPSSFGRLDLWLDIAGPEALAACGSLLETSAVDDLPALARGIWKAVAGCMLIWPDGSHFLDFTPAWQPFDEKFRSLFAVLNQRLAECPGDPKLNGMVWRYAWRASHAETDWLDAAARKQLVASATEFWGRLRPVFREARKDEEAAKAKFLPVETTYDAVYVLAIFGGMWSAIKALLLAFRALSVPAVATDLRYWHETGFDPQPPTPWNWIVEQMVSVIHLCSRREQTREPNLDTVRSSFAEFCLDRLKPKERLPDGVSPSNQDMCESSAAWRHCYVRAIRELRVNPGYRGHRTLFWSAQHDPDPDVRKDARTTYDEIRQHVGLQKGRSPRAAILGAMWVLRQAHLSELGCEIDPDGARRTRAKELARSREFEGVQHRA